LNVSNHTEDLRKIGVTDDERVSEKFMPAKMSDACLRFVELVKFRVMLGGLRILRNGPAVFDRFDN